MTLKEFIGWVLWFMGGTFVGFVVVALISQPVPKEPKLNEKTLYMELCADAGVSAFQCYDRWLRIKYNGN